MSCLSCLTATPAAHPQHLGLPSLSGKVLVAQAPGQVGLSDAPCLPVSHKVREAWMWRCCP